PETLGIPNAILPADAALRLDPAGVLFEWRPVNHNRDGNVRVDVMLNDGRSCSSEATSCTIMGLAEGQSYSWHLHASTRTGLAQDSSVRTFRTDSRPSLPVILSPTEGSHDTLTAAVIRFAPS